MNKDLALKICHDFRPIPVEGGKVKCRFYNDDGICKRPEYFRCELVVHKEKEQQKAISSISVSRVGVVLRCPRLFALNYVYHVEPPIPAQWKIVGRAFSDARAKIDLGLQYELSTDLNSMQVAKARLKAVLRRYAECQRPYGQVLNEVRVFFPYKDTHFVGYIDALERSRETIVEWKYAATEYDEIKSLRQAVVYFKGIPEATRFILATANKPQHKLLKAGKPTKKNPDPKDETPAELEERIYQELCQKPDDEVFSYRTYDRSFFDIDATLEQIYQASTLISAYEKANWPPAFGMNCDNCDFRPYCLKHLTKIGCDQSLCAYPQICGPIKKALALPAPAKLSLLSETTKE